MSLHARMHADHYHDRHKSATFGVVGLDLIVVFNLDDFAGKRRHSGV